MNKFIFLGLFILVAIMPLDVVLAADAPSRFVPCDGTDCDTCDLVTMFNEIIKWLVGFLFLVFAVLIFVSGIKLVTSAGNTEALSSAKSSLGNAFVGIFIVLISWLIVNTVIVNLVSDSSGLKQSWFKLQCFPQVATLHGNGIDEASSEGIHDYNDGVVSEGSLAHADAVERLRTAGVTVNSTGGPGGVRENCTGVSRCTSLHNMRSDTVNQIIKVKEACSGCNITVTGGTEGGHSSGEHSHGSGYKFDIDDTPEVNRFFENKLTRDGTRTGSHGGAQYRDSCGNSYVRESNHWDVSVTNGSCNI